MKIQNFTDLHAWQEGHKLVIMTYKLIESFPAREKFGLASQLSRAVVSITSNIAEGFARQGSKEKIQFYYLALGSVAEARNQLLIAKDVEYITPAKYNKADNQAETIQKLLHGLVKSIKKK